MRDAALLHRARLRKKIVHGLQGKETDLWARNPQVVSSPSPGRSYQRRSKLQQKDPGQRWVERH
jgi:hypothetical protein